MMRGVWLRLVLRLLALCLLLTQLMLRVGTWLPASVKVQAIAYQGERTVYVNDTWRGLVVVMRERDDLSLPRRWRSVPTLQP